MRKAYISCPVSVKQTELDKVAADLRSRGFEVTHWIRGTPYGIRETEAIRLCTDFIMMLPNNAFVSEDLRDDCSGVYKELNAYGETNIIGRATSLLAYNSQQNGLNYYQFDYLNSGAGIKGNTGSSEWFNKYNPYVTSSPKFRFKTEQEMIDDYRQDMISEGEDEDDICDDDWRDHSGDWTEDHDHLLGTVYPYDQFLSDAEFFDEEEENEIFIYEWMITEIKPGERVNSPYQVSSNTSYDRRLLLKNR